MNALSDVDVPVLIVGGGGAGLTCSLLLSELGVRSYLVNRYPGTTRLPRGHILNQRTMEIFSDLDVTDEILAAGTPWQTMKTVSWYSGLGEGPVDARGRRLGAIDAWGAGYTDPDYVAASPCGVANLSLIRLEPILKVRAEQEPSATLRYNHELVDIQQESDGVLSTVLDRGTGETYQVRSSYVLGADGGRTMAKLLGVKVVGSQEIRKMLNLYVSADLSEYLPDDMDSILTWVFNPERPAHLKYGAVLLPLGPKRWGRESEEWVIFLSGEGLDASDQAGMVRRAAESLGIPAFNPTVHAVTEWSLETALAETFRSGRVFLLGDAAHRVPPSGGLGLNSAVQDAYNLCWKLAAVLAGRAGDGLLDTYDAERRPVNQATIYSASNSDAEREVNPDDIANEMGAAGPLGLSPEKTPNENWAALSLLWEDGPGSQERRHRFSQWIGDRTGEFRQHNIEMGYTYESRAVVGDGSPAPQLLDKVRIYQQSTRPGHPLPHAWVDRRGAKVALRSLVHGGHFALIAGEDGLDWVNAAAKLGEQWQIPLRAARVGLGDVELVDSRMAWVQHRGIGRDGALLVRPDGFVAFRSAGRVEDPLGVLGEALRSILSTPFA